MSTQEQKNKVDSSKLFTLSTLTNILKDYSDKEYYQSGPSFYREILNERYTSLDLNPPNTDIEEKGNYLSGLCNLNFKDNHLSKPALVVEISKLIALYYIGELDKIRQQFEIDFDYKSALQIKKILESPNLANKYKNLPPPESIKNGQHSPYNLMVIYMLYSFSIGDDDDLPGNIREPAPKNINKIFSSISLPITEFVQDILQNHPRIVEKIKKKTVMRYNELPVKALSIPAIWIETLVEQYIKNGDSCPPEKASPLKIPEELFKQITQRVANTEDPNVEKTVTVILEMLKTVNELLETVNEVLAVKESIHILGNEKGPERHR